MISNPLLLKEKKERTSIELRRKRNREAMQRARQRDKEYMDDLRQQAAALEKTHSALLAKVDAKLAQFSLQHGDSLTVDSGNRISAIQAKLEAARKEAQQLMEQNLHFQDKIVDRIKSEDRMEGLLGELVREQEAQEQRFKDILYGVDIHTSIVFTEERAMEEILASRHGRTAVEKKGFRDTQSIDLFGWTTQHRFEGNELHLSFKKVFPNRTAYQVMTQNWANELKLVTYRNSVQAASQQWTFLQKINNDTYLLEREVVDPNNEGKRMRLLYLRFRLFEPDGSYAIVIQSIQQPHVKDGNNMHHWADKIWASEACMWTQFIPVIDSSCPNSTREHCEVRMIGKSVVGDAKTAHDNVLETIMGVLRWENINVGPMLSLTHTSCSE